MNVEVVDMKAVLKSIGVEEASMKEEVKAMSLHLLNPDFFS
jgi:hypothetical protein